MNPLSLIRLLALAVALAVLGPTAARARDPSPTDPIMAVVPADLKWEDAKSIPPGAKFAVIEGPSTNRSRILSGSSFPPTTRFRPIGIPRLSVSR
jgi:hypothetical protein